MAEEVATRERFDPRISDQAFEYLAIQRGRISDLSGDRQAWEQAYRQSLLGDFFSMLPHLPAAADRILDVGSGLGGINILLARHFKLPEIWLLDGDDDSPVMVRHGQTFNCMQTARAFLAANGVPMVLTVSPAQEAPPAPCDLIISLQSWCFHFNPETYLDYVRQFTKPGTVLILDVRKSYKTWNNILDRAFARVCVAHEGEKFERVIFQAT